MASKCQQTGTNTFLDEIGNVEAILNSIFSTIAPQTQKERQKKTDIDIFTQVHGRRHLENCRRFLSPGAGECATAGLLELGSDQSV